MERSFPGIKKDNPCLKELCCTVEGKDRELTRPAQIIFVFNEN